MQILHPPSVQFKLYQGEVFQYKPGTRDWVESTQTETPEIALRSERGQRLSRQHRAGSVQRDLVLPLNSSDSQIHTPEPPRSGNV